ncbi:MAG: hypothetical protein H7248_10380 [Microbacteriaceae bacterium]|nr:hypothetical protein [Microbacteriaceae bacterium]
MSAEEEQFSTTRHLIYSTASACRTWTSDRNYGAYTSHATTLMTSAMSSASPPKTSPTKGGDNDIGTVGGAVRTALAYVRIPATGRCRSRVPPRSEAVPCSVPCPVPCPVPYPDSDNTNDDDNETYSCTVTCTVTCTITCTIAVI